MWNSNLRDMGYEFGRVFGSNLAIGVSSCWLDLSPSRPLYIGCMGSSFS
jgi:hypothetical protein